MRLPNGTIWRWNRPCYGVIGGRPHLRIKFRALPSGPTVVDQVANAAFLLGLVNGLVEECDDVATRFPFEAAHDNFFAAACHGLDAPLHWFDKTAVAAPALITRVLLPLALRGLMAAGVDRASANEYLLIIEERVECGLTGSAWALGALPLLDTQGLAAARDQRLVQMLLARQRTSQPVHQWEPPRAEECALAFYGTVAEIMTTDLSTIGPADPLSLAASIMEWRHVPVEDDAGKLVGVLSMSDVVRMPPASPVRDAMSSISSSSSGFVSVTPDTPTVTALQLMRVHKMDCLPVIERGRLAGLVTTHDMLAILSLLLVPPTSRTASVLTHS